MPPLRIVLGLLVVLGVAGCTDEGEGSATMTGVGYVIPWWVIGIVVLAWIGVVRLRKRRRR